MFLAGCLKIIATVVRFSTIFLPQGSGFRIFFVPRGGDLPGGLPGVMVRLGFD